MAAAQIRVSINNQQKRLQIPTRTFRELARKVLGGEGIREAVVSIAVVDDPTMQQLNRQYLNHDYATDVLSFLLESDGDSLEGEIILSADTAVNSAPEYGWTADEELQLYLVHGLLHLVGYDDHSPSDQKRMRAKEKEYLGMEGGK